MSKTVFKTENAIAITDSYICSLDMFALETLTVLSDEERSIDATNYIIMKWKFDEDEDFGSDIYADTNIRNNSNLISTDVLYLITSDGVYISTTISDLQFGKRGTSTVSTDKSNYQKAMSSTTLNGSVTSMENIGFHKVTDTNMSDFITWETDEHFSSVTLI